MFLNTVRSTEKLPTLRCRAAHEKCCAPQFYRHASFAQLAPRSDCAGGWFHRFPAGEIDERSRTFSTGKIRHIPSFTEVLTSSLALSFAVNAAKRRLEKNIKRERSFKEKERKEKGRKSKKREGGTDCKKKGDRVRTLDLWEYSAFLLFENADNRVFLLAVFPTFRSNCSIVHWVDLVIF